MLAAIRSLIKGPEPTGPTRLVRAFGPGDQTLSRAFMAVAGDAHFAQVAEPQSLRLYEFKLPPLEAGRLTYRAEIKTQGLKGKAYLELWCRLPGQGEFFSKGLHAAVSGSNDWTGHETPFALKQGQVPDRAKLNLAVEGRGKVWIRAVELIFTPMDW